MFLYNAYKFCIIYTDSQKYIIEGGVRQRFDTVCAEVYFSFLFYVKCGKIKGYVVVSAWHTGFLH